MNYFFRGSDLMHRSTRFLLVINRTLKLHETLLKEVCHKYDLSVVEAEVVSFLHNNPGKDTAADIVELRMLSKGCVSKAVDSLMTSGYLRRTQDPEDRRKQHLALTDKAAPITEEIDRIQKRLRKIVFDGFDGQDLKQFENYMDKMYENIRFASQVQKKGEEHHE